MGLCWSDAGRGFVNGALWTGGFIAVAAGLSLIPGAAPFVVAFAVGFGIGSLLVGFYDLVTAPSQSERDYIAGSLIGGLVVGGAAGRVFRGIFTEESPRAPRACPKPSPKFQPPTNPPHMPPTDLPPGWTVWRGSPTSDYPNGYWKMYAPQPKGNPQPIDPSTMKPAQGGRPSYHVEFPPGYKGPFDN